MKESKRFAGILAILTVLTVGISIGAATLNSSADNDYEQEIAPQRSGLMQHQKAPRQGQGSESLFGNNNERQKTPRQGPGGLFDNDKVQKDVSYLTNGIQENLTTSDDTIKEKLYQMADMMTEKHNENAPENITLSVEKTDNGIVISKTSDDAEVVARLKAQAEMQELSQTLRDQEIDVQANINREVVEIDNGVQVNITSENTDIQKLIKLHEKYQPMGEQKGERNQKGGGMRGQGRGFNF